MRKANKIVSAILIVGLLVLVTACGNTQKSDTGSQGKTAAAATDANKKEALKGDLGAKVTLVAGTPGWQHSMAFIADKQGYWKEAGLSGMEFKPLQTGTAAGEAIGGGSAQIGYTNTTTAIALIANGAPVKILSGTATGGNGVVVWNKDINSVEKLKGKKIGVPQGRTVHELEFRLNVLKQAGMTVNDVKLVPINPQDTYLPLSRGEIDAAVMYDPYISIAISKGATLLVPPEKMWNGPAYFTVLIATNDLIQKNPALVQAVTDVHAKTVKFTKENPQKASEILSGVSRQDLAVTLDSLKTNILLAEANAKELQVFVDAMKDDGQIKTAPDMNTAVDASFIQKSVGK